MIILNDVAVGRIYEIESLAELRAYLLSAEDSEALREELFDEFLKYADYKNVSDWNKAVRQCEALAIIGWGGHEPLEAVRGTYFNGNPETFFLNRYSETRFVDAIWSKRVSGYTMEAGRTNFFASSDDPLHRPTVLQSYPVTECVMEGCLASQRNWIAKNPIRIIRGLDNCYPSSRPVIDSIENALQKALDQHMRPELYGEEINRIVITCSYSFYDNAHCKTNYVIADESLRLRPKDFYPKLLTMYSSEEIEREGYYLRNRFSIGPFRRDTGNIYVTIVLEREFSMMDYQEQREMLATYFRTVLERIAARQKGKLAYDFALMMSDFNRLLDKWLE